MVSGRQGRGCCFGSWIRAGGKREAGRWIWGWGGSDVCCCWCLCLVVAFLELERKVAGGHDSVGVSRKGASIARLALVRLVN